MKFKHFFMAALLLLTLPLSSKLTAQVLIKAGVNLASIAESSELEGYNELKNKSVLGFQGGLAFDLVPKGLFSLQPELLFIQKGGKVAYELDENNRVESRYYYNYLEVPVLAKLKFLDEESRSGFYLIGGPYVGLAISGKVKNTVTLLGQTSTSTDKFKFDNDDPEERQKRLDWGVSFGGGFKFGGASIDLRYNLGINNLLDNDSSNQNDSKAYRRNRGLGLTLGFGI